MTPSSTRVAFRHLKQSRDSALLGISIMSLNMRILTWWSDMERLIKAYWRAQSPRVRRSPNKIIFSVEVNGEMIPCEIKGHISKLMVSVRGKSLQFGSDVPLDEIVFWIDHTSHQLA